MIHNFRLYLLNNKNHEVESPKSILEAILKEGVGHHILSRFRSDFSEVFDEFVVQSIVLLQSRNLLKLKKVSQDGTKIKASASVMHRKKSLITKAIDVRKHIKQLEKQVKSGEFEKEERKRKKGNL